MHSIFPGLCLFTGAALSRNAKADDFPLQDRTLVVWTAPANLEQRDGSVMCISSCGSFSDSIAFGERSPGKWMLNRMFPNRETGKFILSEDFNWTNQDEAGWPGETAGPDEFVQVAVVYKGSQIFVYRNGALITECSYTYEHDRKFRPSDIVAFGPRYMRAGKFNTPSYQGIIQDARIYNIALDQATIAALAPGQISDPQPWAWWAFGEGDFEQDRMGRYGDVRTIGSPELTPNGVVLQDNDTLAYLPIVEKSVEPYRAETWDLIPQGAIKNNRMFRNKLLDDKWRPGYHFCMPEDRCIDPNGAFYANGRYHLMYLWGLNWGHISSLDLVHWRHHHDAIGESNGDKGCFSGGAFVDDDGTGYITYWITDGPRGVGIARSSDRHYDLWTKSLKNPIIKATEFGVNETTDADGNFLVYGSADPSNIWKKDGVYYFVTGNVMVLDKFGRAPDSPEDMKGDWVDLFRSENLEDWEYVHRFYERSDEWTHVSEDNMCPSFLPLPSSPDGGEPSGKHLLLFLSHNRGAHYYVGEYRDDKFYPENHGRFSWKDSLFFAPEAMVDGKGRQIAWAWIVKHDDPEWSKTQGWNGIYSLPRSLWLGEDGTLRMRPVEELKTLRYNKMNWNNITVSDGGSRRLEGIAGDTCDLEIVALPGAYEQCGLKVRTSPGGEEETLIYYDVVNKELVVDTLKSGKKGHALSGRANEERAPFELHPGEELELRVLIDKSVVEVFANDRQAIARLIFPEREDSLGVVLFSKGATTHFHTVTAWEMMPSNPY